MLGAMEADPVRTPVPFDELVKTLEDYRIRSQTFTHGQVASTISPMEVDAFTSKGKMKG